jgi:hypothetical protein
MSYWACAQLETRRERTALHFLGLNGFTTYCPRVRTERPSRDRERSTRLFPGYAFVWIELQWHAARWAPGVGCHVPLMLFGGQQRVELPKADVRPV